MKRQRMKDVAMGAIVASLVVGVTPVAFAKVSKMDIPVSFNNIKVVVDGKELKTDKEPFTYEGTTYLPVRAVGEAVGKDVKWDSATQTVTLSSGVTKETTPEAKPEEKKETVESDKVVYDRGGIKVVYKNVTEGISGKNINVIVENSSGKDYTVQVRDFSANGYMVDTIFSCDVVAGKKANDEITITKSSLEKSGITEVNSVEFKLHIFESEDWGNSTDSEAIDIKVK